MSLQVGHTWCRVFAESASKALAVTLHVVAKTVLASVLPFAPSALEDLRSVGMHVILKIPLVREGLRTIGAAERTVLHMAGTHMSFQASLVGGDIFTMAALVILRPRGTPVDPSDVRGQVPLAEKLSFADVTFEFRLLKMRQRVSLQTGATVETFITTFTAKS